MKQKIIEILKTDWCKYPTYEDMADEILKLFPRKCFPDIDGWPTKMRKFLIGNKQGDVELMTYFPWSDFTNSGDYFANSGGSWDKRNIVWWLPVSEILEMLGDKK